MRWYQDPIIVATLVIAFASVTSLLIAALTWLTSFRYTKITRQIFEASYRPYIAVVESKVENDQESRQFRATFNIKNVGSVPAYDFRGTIKFETPEGVIDIPAYAEARAVIPPQTSYPLVAVIRNPRDYERLNSAAILDVVVSAEYKGVVPKKDYHYERKGRLNKELNNFMVIGDLAT